MAVEIRPLGVQDAAAYSVIRRRSLELEPKAFASSPQDDPGTRPEGARERLAPEQVAAGTVTFGAFAPDLVGITTIHREGQGKLRHKAWIFGVFVEPSHRRSGLAASLLERAIAHARTLQGVEVLLLGVNADAPPALALYERFGFVRFGVEPHAMKLEGGYVDEIMMRLALQQR